MVRNGSINPIELIVCDLEATCWDDDTGKDQMETIEIGAVRVQQGVVKDEFSSFVRPMLHGRLSEFCKTLTTIQQTDVDAALAFSDVFNNFLDWIGDGPFIFCSWGRYDVHQLQLDCSRLGISWPHSLSNHVNVKHVFAQWRQVPACGLDRAMRLAGLTLEGTHHRGIHDARNIARLTIHMLPWILEKNRNLLPE